MARNALSCLIALAGLLFPTASANPLMGPDSGKPVPRFESLKYGEVNGRRGPSADQQILWTYHRRGLPVRVVAESGPWRRIEDPSGDLSWVSAAMLDPRRTAFVLGPQPAALRRNARGSAHPVALLAQGVIAQLKDCQLGWRELRVGDRQGWTEVAALWGADQCDSGP